MSYVDGITLPEAMLRQAPEANLMRIYRHTTWNEVQREIRKHEGEILVLVGFGAWARRLINRVEKLRGVQVLKGTFASAPGPLWMGILGSPQRVVRAHPISSDPLRFWLVTEGGALLDLESN